jgi:hypothetical protein
VWQESRASGGAVRPRLGIRRACLDRGDDRNVTPSDTRLAQSPASWRAQAQGAALDGHGDTGKKSVEATKRARRNVPMQRLPLATPHDGPLLLGEQLPDVRAYASVVAVLVLA